jgi:hypothetical protein
MGIGEVERGRCDADAEDRPRRGVTTRRFEGERGRMGLVPRGVVGVRGGLSGAWAALDDERIWPREPDIGVGVSGGLGGRSRVDLEGVWGELATRVGAVGPETMALRGLDCVARCRDIRSLAGVGGRSLRFLCSGWRLGRLVLSRNGDTSASLVDDDEAGIADCDFGDGSACEYRCRAGDDMEPCRRVGATKRAVLSSAGLGGMGEGEGVTDCLPPLRKPHLLLSFSFVSSAAPARSFPLPTAVATPVEMVRKSPTTGCAVFFERVAVRRLCSKEERMRWKVLGAGSGAPAAVETLRVAEGC